MSLLSRLFGEKKNTASIAKNDCGSERRRFALSSSVRSIHCVAIV